MKSGQPPARAGTKPTAKQPGFARPLVSVDLAIFAIRDEQLHVLLMRRPNIDAEPYPGQFALPGGFVDVDKDPDLQACALRKLREKTGVASPYLEQVGTWGDARRDPRGWSVTSLYFALIAEAAARAAATDAVWQPVSDEGVTVKLAFDHVRLLRAAMQRLRAKVEYTSLPAFLLPQEFTLPQLQRVFEIVLGRALDKSGFRTRVVSAGLVEPTGSYQPGMTRPAALYRLAAQQAMVFPRALVGE